MSVQALNPLEDPHWDRRLAALPEAGFFHGAAWPRVLHEAYGFTPRYFGCTTSDRLSSLLPLMEVDSWATGRRAVSLPFTDACTALSPTGRGFTPLFEAALALAAERRWIYLELRGGESFLPEVPPAFSFWGHRLALGRDTAKLFSRISGAARRGVRTARANGLTCEVSDSFDAMVAFYRLLGPTRQRHGVPPQPFRFFAALHREVIARRQGCVMLVRSGKTAIAGAVFLHARQQAIYKYGASLAAHQRLRPNNLLMWEAIAWHARHGFDELLFGRTSLDNDGLRRFKLGWGAEEYPIHYFRYQPRRAHFVSPGRDAHPWQRRIFRRLPLPLSRLVGTALYRHAG